MKAKHLPLRATILLTIIGLLAGSLPPPALAAAAPTDIPAPLPAGAPTATVNLSATSGYITQLITVSGQTSAPAAGVRVTWVYNDADQTVTAAVVNTTGSSYSVQVSVPLDAQPGPAKVCATVTNSATARLTCANFTVTAPPTGAVSGQAPAPAAGTEATVHLLDQSGRSVASAPVAANGAFQLNNVAPGRYRAAIEGGFSQLVRFSDIVVTPGGNPTIAYFPWDGERNADGAPCLFGSDAKVTQLSGIPSHLNSFGIVDMDGARVMKTTAPYYQGASPKPKPQATYDFGIYLSGVPLTVEFQAYVQRKGNVTVQRVEYYRQTGNAAPVLIGSATAKPWTFQYNVGQLPPGQTRLIAVPVVNGQQQCATFHTIQVLANPTASPKWQPGAKTEWDSAAKHYKFEGTMPNAAGLPLIFDTPSLPLVGVLQNRLGAGVYVEGVLTLDGQVWLSAMDATAYARLMSIDVYNKPLDLDPGNKTLAQWLKPSDYASLAHQTPRFPLTSFRQDMTIFGGPLFAIPPWVVVRASISVGVGGELSLSAKVYPLRPGLEVELRPSVSAWLGLTVTADVLFGIAGAEGTAQPGVTVALPFKVNVDNDPPAWFDDPCLTIFVRLILKGRFLFFTWTFFDQPIVNEHIPSGCNAQQAMAQLAALAGQSATNLTAASTLEAPALAADPIGRMVMVYVEDAGGATPAPRVMARFKPAGSDVWGAAIPVTDGSRSVSDPVVAFAGPGNTPIVAWTQNTLPPSSAPPTGGDLGETLKQQEIYVATWNGSAWSAPLALTNDAVGDGRPAIAGDTQGATLAWTRDTDGDLRTRTDQRIAVREWTPAGAWSARQLLGAAPTGGMNAQVSVARLVATDPASGAQTSRRVLVWAFDADGDPNTAADRRLAVATPDAAGGWNPQLLGELTRRADSPTVSLSLNDLGSADLAFLVRGVDGDGQTDIGPLSNRAQLWAAKYSFADGSVFNAAPVPGENGAAVYAERPRLTSSAAGETLLAFRRFGTPDDNTWLGQIALARRAGTGASFSAPLLLTNEPRQNWQAAIALNPSNGQAVVAKIGSAPVQPLGMAADEHLARLAAQSDERFAWASMAAQADDTTLDIVTLRPEADPALDLALALSQAHPAVGSTVTVSATVRNLGRNTAAEAQVCFYRGAPGSGVLVECRGVPPLGFNASRTVAVGMVAAAGAQPIYAEVIPTAEDANPQNNRSVADLGALPAPQAVGVQESPLYEASLAVQWLPLAVPGVAGYRILRGTQPAGPYELVGEATGVVFNDLPLPRGRTFYYVVQAYDASGVVSPYSQEVSGALPRLSTYLPAILR